MLYAQDFPKVFASKCLDYPLCACHESPALTLKQKYRHHTCPQPNLDWKTYVFPPYRISINQATIKSFWYCHQHCRSVDNGLQVFKGLKFIKGTHFNIFLYWLVCVTSILSISMWAFNPCDLAILTKLWAILTERWASLVLRRYRKKGSLLFAPSFGFTRWIRRKAMSWTLCCQRLLTATPTEAVGALLTASPQSHPWLWQQHDINYLIQTYTFIHKTSSHSSGSIDTVTIRCSGPQALG